MCSDGRAVLIILYPRYSHALYLDSSKYINKKDYTHIKDVLDSAMFYYQARGGEARDKKRRGGRVVCVGTTSCRTVESAADENGLLQACSGNTEIFIYPGYRFKVLDCLITNFHLPESTLVMLVSALAGREHVLEAYREAVEERYRFFSFGDVMLVK